MLKNKQIEIIVPFLNEEENLPKLHQKLSNVVAPFEGKYSFSFLFIDDGSTDSSVNLLKRLMSSDHRIKIISLSRNFGKENALTAGLDHSLADAVIFIDADLQHPPQLIPEMIAQWERGVDIVTAVKKVSGSRYSLKKIGAKLFYYIFEKFGNMEFTPHNTDFRLIDRKVIDEIVKIREQNRLFRGLVDWVGFGKSFIEFTPDKRTDGEVRYSYLKLVNLALNGFVSFSQIPLKMILFLSGLILLLNFLSLIIFLTFDIPYSSSFAYFIIIFLLSLILFAIGVVGIYLGATLQNSTNRPLYIIKEKIVASSSN